MANNEPIKGIVEAVKKDKKGLKVNGNWYSNAYIDPIEANKGDEVELTLNFKGFLDSVKVLTKGQTDTNKPENIRHLVDAGNLLQRGTEKSEQKFDTLKQANDELLKEFFYLAECLKIGQIIPRAE